MTSFDAHIEAYGETCQLWGASTGTDEFGNPEQTWDTDKGTFTGVVIRPTLNRRGILTRARSLVL
jgi:hypothetical protein